jgi:hypothetical protein
MGSLERTPMSVLTGTTNTAVAVRTHSGVLTKEAGRAAVLAIEDKIKQLPQIDPPLEHGFAPGVYARKMFIKAGVALTGKIHKYAHWNVLLRGRIVIITEKGRREMVAPAMFVSPPGTKRAGYALEDTEWVTIHPTEETNIETIESQIAVDTYEELAALSVDGEVIK